MAAAAPTLDALQGLIFAAARRADIPSETSRRIALWALEGIVSEFGSSQLYIPGQRLALIARDETIAANFRAGVTIERICRMTGLSRRSVLRILQRFNRTSARLPE